MSSQYSAFSRRSRFLLGKNTKGGVKYALKSGPTYDVTRDAIKATETIIIRSRDLKAFHSEAMPPPFFIFLLSRVLPYRRLPGAPWMILESFTSKPHNPDLPGDPFEGHKDESINIDPDDPTFSVDEFDNRDPPGNPGERGHPYSEFYELVLTYTSQLEANDNQQDPDDPETFLEVQKQGGGQFLSIPPTNTSTNSLSVDKFDSPGEAPSGSTLALPDKTNQDQQQGIAIPVPTIEYTLTWPLVINPPFTLMDLALGKVNGTFMPLFDNSPLETVLFMGYNAKRKFIWDGATGRAQPWEIQYKFSKRAVNRSSRTPAGDDIDPVSRAFGWNHQYSPTDGEWVRIILANGRSIHDKTNFNLLFRTTPAPVPVV